MAGHSHWAQVKHKKGAVDAKRGKLFSKLLNEVAIAARGGADPEGNTRLRMAAERARSFQVPQENIERAIKRGAGLTGETQLEEVRYEAYGPGGAAVVIRTITDNRNRTLGEIKAVLNKLGGKLAEGAAVRWLFEERGVIRMNRSDFSEALMLALIEAGAQDVRDEEDQTLVLADQKNLEPLKRCLQERGIEILDSQMELVAKNEINIDQKTKEQLDALAEALDELPDVEEIYTNTA